MPQEIKQIVENYFKDKDKITTQDIVKLENIVGAKYNKKIITVLSSTELNNQTKIIEYLKNEVQK